MPLVALAMVWLCPVHCFAAETDEIRAFVEEDTLWQYAPEGITRESVEQLTKGDSYASFWNGARDFLLQLFSVGLRDGIKLLARLAGILLLGAVFRAMNDTKSDGSLQTVFRYVLLLTLTVTLWQTLESGIALITDTMNGVCSFLLASVPVTGMLMAMDGQVERATLQGVSLQHVIGLFSVITTHVLGPVLRFLLALTLAGSLSDGSLSGVAAVAARFIKRGCLFLFTLLSAILALQNALAAAADSVAMRAVRFAAGSFIPVVGNLVGEASRTVAAGISLIRKECGVGSVLILAYLLARPVVMLLIQKAVLSLADGMSGILGDNCSGALFRGVRAVWDLLLAVTAFQGCYCVFSIVLFMGGGGSG